MLYLCVFMCVFLSSFIVILRVKVCILQTGFIHDYYPIYYFPKINKHYLLQYDFQNSVSIGKCCGSIVLKLCTYILFHSLYNDIISLYWFCFYL